MRTQLIAAALVALACVVAAADPATPAGPTTVPVINYVRFDDDGHGGGKMQAAVGRYANADGVTVDLIATMHVGDADFFRQLAQRFPAYDAVLYELVNPHGVPPTEEGVSDQQRKIARDMGLENQGPHMDYRRKNFVHADLELEQFKKLEVAQNGTFKGALGEGPGITNVRNPDEARGEDPIVADLKRAAKTTNKLEKQRLYRRAYAGYLVLTSEPAEGATYPAKMEVVVGARNEKVMSVLADQVAAGKRKVAVLYGGAHMVDLERKLFAAGYARQSLEWATAWTVEPDGTPTTQPVKVKTR